MALSPVARPPGIAGAAPVRADIRRSRRVLPVGFYDRRLGDDSESAELIKPYRADDMAGEWAGQQGDNDGDAVIDRVERAARRQILRDDDDNVETGHCLTPERSFRRRRPVPAISECVVGSINSSRAFGF
jgi:hypothetical protein